MTSVQNTTAHRKNTELHRGVKVRVRLYGGEIVERLVWNDLDDFVFVCTNRNYELLRTGRNAPSPIGFPRGDILDCSYEA